MLRGDGRLIALAVPKEAGADRHAGDHVGPLDLEDHLAGLAGQRRLDAGGQCGADGSHRVGVFRQAGGRQRRAPGANSVAADAVARVDGLGILALVGNVIRPVGPAALILAPPGLARVAVVQAVVVPRVGFALAEIEDIAVAEVPVVVVVAIFQAPRVETVVFLGQGPHRVAPGQEAVGAGGVQAVVAGDVAGLSLAAAGPARAVGADILHAGNRGAVAERVEGRQRTVVHVVAAVVLHFRHRVHADVPELHLQPHRAPDRAVGPGNRAAHRVAVVVELADGVGQLLAVEDHRRRLAAGDMVPVPDRPALVFGLRPGGRDAVDHAADVRVIRVGVRDHLEVADLRPGRSVSHKRRQRHQKRSQSGGRNDRANRVRKSHRRVLVGKVRAGSVEAGTTTRLVIPTSAYFVGSVDVKQRCRGKGRVGQGRRGGRRPTRSRWRLVGVMSFDGQLE